MKNAILSAAATAGSPTPATSRTPSPYKTWLNALQNDGTVSVNARTAALIVAIALDELGEDSVQLMDEDDVHEYAGLLRARMPMVWSAARRQDYRSVVSFLRVSKVKAREFSHYEAEVARILKTTEKPRT